jgi:GNAT superfamily N-acetyltransferase
MDDLRKTFESKFDDELRLHLNDIDLDSVTRIPNERLSRTALPNIGLIELVSADDFRDNYESLYNAMFHAGERERSDLIYTRLDEDSRGLRKGLFPFHIVGIKDHNGQAAGAAHFCVLFLPGGEYAVPYLNYIYVRPESRRQDLSELLHTLVLGIAMADARAYARGGQVAEVPYTLFETEPVVHGEDDVKRAKAAERTKVHTKSGGVALMLKMKEDGRLISSHVQPGLDAGEPPLTLIWVLRANPGQKLSLDGNEMGGALIKAYYKSLREEGFLEENIALAEGMVNERFREAREFCLLPLSAVQKEMYVGIDGIDDTRTRNAVTID